MRTERGSPHFRDAVLGKVCPRDRQVTGHAEGQTECRTEGRETGAYRMAVSEGRGRLTREK